MFSFNIKLDQKAYLVQGTDPVHASRKRVMLISAFISTFLKRQQPKK